jgi:hypothetical protein
MANLLYQHNVTQQTKRERKTKNKSPCKTQLETIAPFLTLTFYPPSQAIEAVQ